MLVLQTPYLKWESYGENITVPISGNKLILLRNDSILPNIEGLMNAASLASGQGGDLPQLIRADIV
jgi:hypothetical protein